MARRLGFLALLMGACLSLMGSAYPLAQAGEQQESRWWVWVLVALILLALAAYIIWWWLNPKEDTPAVPAHRVEGVTLPGVELPKVEAPSIGLPEVKLPGVELPKVEAPSVELPAAELPDVGLPRVEAPSIGLPEVKLPDVELPKVEVPSIGLPEVKLPDVRAPEVTLPEVELPEVEAPGLGATATRAASLVDDLKVIEGIGPKIASVLNAAGVVSFRQLADLTPDRILEILGNADPRLLRLADPATWPQQARLAADGAWDELQALTDQLKGGRRA